MLQVMLKSIESGHLDSERDESGAIFVDRNGKLFEYILDYLRDPKSFTCPIELCERLIIEADFFRIPQMVAYLDYLLRGSIMESRSRIGIERLRHCTTSTLTLKPSCGFRHRECCDVGRCRWWLNGRGLFRWHIGGPSRRCPSLGCFAC